MVRFPWACDPPPVLCDCGHTYAVLVTCLLLPFACTLAYAQYRERTHQRRPAPQPDAVLRACRAILDHLDTLDLKEQDLIVLCDHLKCVYEHA